MQATRYLLYPKHVLVRVQKLVPESFCRMDECLQLAAQVTQACIQCHRQIHRTLIATDPIQQGGLRHYYFTSGSTTWGFDGQPFGNICGNPVMIQNIVFSQPFELVVPELDPLVSPPRIRLHHWFFTEDNKRNSSDYAHAIFGDYPVVGNPIMFQNTASGTSYGHLELVVPELQLVVSQSDDGRSSQFIMSHFDDSEPMWPRMISTWKIGGEYPHSPGSTMDIDQNTVGGRELRQRLLSSNLFHQTPR